MDWWRRPPRFYILTALGIIVKYLALKKWLKNSNKLKKLNNHRIHEAKFGTSVGDIYYIDKVRYFMIKIPQKNALWGDSFIVYELCLMLAVWIKQQKVNSDPFYPEVHRLENKFQISKQEPNWTVGLLLINLSKYTHVAL